MSEMKDLPDRLRAVMEALAEHEDSLSDDEVLSDVAAAGVDAQAEAERVRNVLLGAVRKHKRSRLDRAEEEHRHEVAQIAAAAVRLPTTPMARRARLQRAVERAPRLRESLTLQFRGLESISDEDVESALRQLQHLGLLDDEPDER